MLLSQKMDIVHMFMTAPSRSCVPGLFVARAPTFYALNLCWQIIALEGSNMNMQTFNAMRSGAKAMQDARGRLDVDQVDDVMDDIKDEMDIAEQVS